MPNHHLFQLAEHPPAMMADLLRAFGGAGPPVFVKTKAEELLSVIRDAVARGLEDAPSAQPVVQPVVPEPVAGPSSSKMTTLDPVIASRLWGTETTAVPTVGSSALFGPKKSKLLSDLATSSPAPRTSNVKATSSTLFSTGKGKAKAAEVLLLHKLILLS